MPDDTPVASAWSTFRVAQISEYAELARPKQKRSSGRRQRRPWSRTSGSAAGVRDHQRAKGLDANRQMIDGDHVAEATRQAVCFEHRRGTARHFGGGLVMTICPSLATSSGSSAPPAGAPLACSRKLAMSRASAGEMNTA